MASSFVSCNLHCIFSTKQRRNLIFRDMQQRLWAYLGGVARDQDIICLSAGGVENHVHMLLAMPSTITIARALQLIKGNSSKWISDTFPSAESFEWQKGYGAFSVGSSQIKVVRAYIEGQEEHHGSTTFEEEYLAFLDRYGIECDERYVFG
ncbi:MAG TPA: IS200/IS605 family transposase [Phycisphaerae bacterium]|nr:IS200/IS605 family transposase [Phycisphaerae bacterium]